MSAVPVEIDGDVYAKAERKAHALSTSVSEVISAYLRQWVQEEDARNQARETMRQRFADPDWEFAVGELESREERNARR